tara:strand:+ start:80 stop:295 length:216 start_codon:yes stop_codon:yes gene_type:complete
MNRIGKYYDFMEAIYEVAFGDDAINRDFTKEEVLEKLREYSDKALKFDELGESIPVMLETCCRNGCEKCEQ